MIKQRRKVMWVCCPNCGKAQFPLQEETVIKNLILRCKMCGKEIFVNTQGPEP